MKKQTKTTKAAKPPIAELPGRFGNHIDAEREERRFFNERYGADYRPSVIGHLRWMLTEIEKEIKTTEADWEDLWFACSHSASVLSCLRPQRIPEGAHPTSEATKRTSRFYTHYELPYERQVSEIRARAYVELKEHTAKSKRRAA